VNREGDEVPGVGLGLAEVRVHSDDGALFAGRAEAGADGGFGADVGEIDEGVSGAGEAGGAEVGGVGDGYTQIGASVDRDGDQGEKHRR
jgi:hypothetical protein